MRIGIQTWGSTGDVRPFLALARGLAAAGHDITLVITDIEDHDFTPYAKEGGYRVKHVATPVIRDARVMDEIGLRLLHEKNIARQSKMIMTEVFLPAEEEMFAAAKILCKENELVIRHFFHHPLQIAALKSGIPDITVTLAPSTIPTREICPTGFPNWGAWANPLWWKIARTVINKMFLKSLNQLRLREGLLPAHDLFREVWNSERLNLIAFSQVICGHPRDWNACQKPCGFFRLQRDFSKLDLPEELAHFLEDGEPPLFVTFGSLTPKGEKTFPQWLQDMQEAARFSEVRAVIQVPKQFLEELKLEATNKNLCYVSDIEHQIIFPRCLAVIHHGGAGTTQTTLFSKVPCIVVPHIADQFYWAKEMFRLGLGPKPLPFLKFSSRDLAKRIKLLKQNPAYSEAARTVGTRVCAEDGVARAVEEISYAAIRE